MVHVRLCEGQAVALRLQCCAAANVASWDEVGANLQRLPAVKVYNECHGRLTLAGSFKRLNLED